MKTILVSQRLIESETYQERREALDVRWGSFLEKCGLLPVPVPCRAPIKPYFDTVRPAGILLTGGNSLACFNPRDSLSRERDNFERALIDAGMRRSLPIIGVCRGFQMLAWHFKSRLELRDGHAGKVHPVEFKGGGLLSSIYGRGRRVNSFHNYCVTAVKADLRVAAVAPDGTIEAVEHRRRPIYGIMWHPERNRPFRSQDVRFFGRVFAT